MVGFPPIPRISHKNSGETRTVHTWWVERCFGIFGNKGDIWRLILKCNPAGHCFLLRALVWIELFQIIHNCVSEWMLSAKVLLKLVYKLLEILFFLICGIFQYVIFLFNRRRKFKLLGLQGDPISTILFLSVTSWSLHEINTGGDWSAYCNDFLSKQKFFNM